MSASQAAILFIAAVLAGMLNSVAGGGSFITFPALVFAGVPPIRANATSTVALWPGSAAGAAAYRKDFTTERRTAVLLGVISFIGGLLGAILLLRTPQQTFTRLVPFLLLFATLLFTFSGRITAAFRKGNREAPGSVGLPIVVVGLIQLLIATYGGYFGGGIGVLMLAALAVMGLENIHTMNAVKNLLATCINGVAVFYFAAQNAVVWPQALLMIVGAIIGGYVGGSQARKLDPKLVRRFVILVGFAMTIYFFVRA